MEASVTLREGAKYRFIATLLTGALLLSACGDDDDDGGGSAGGGNGGTSGGKGGNSSAGKGGGTSSESGAGGSENGGGSSGDGPGSSGSGQGGSGAMSGQGGSSTAGTGEAGQGGGHQGGDGGAAQAGGGAGGVPATIEYRACETATALTRIFVHRIDESAGTCTRVVLVQANSCNLGVAAGGWCLEQALVSADVAACKALTLPSNPKNVSSATGSISVSGTTVDIDVTLQFPAGGGLPSSVSVKANDCSADCMLNDCRP
jgi:hypothetical protein